MKRRAQPAWMVRLNGDPTPWLLEDSNPCVRYRTLTELLGRPTNDAEVRRTGEAIWTYPPAKRLLNALAEVEPFPPGTAWSGKLFKQCRGDIDILSRFGIPRGHPAVQRACEQWLDVDIRPGPGCYQHQTVAGLIRYADLADPRLMEKVRFTLSNELFVDGDRPGAVRYGGMGSCCGAHSCHSAAVRALWAVIGLPEQKRTPEAREFIRRGARYLALHRLYQSSHEPGKVISKHWRDLHPPFAVGWQTDILDLLDVATQAGLERDESIVDALDLLLSKQNMRGRWRVEAALRWDPGRLIGHVADVEPVGAESKWITLGALLVVNRCERLLAGAKRTDLGRKTAQDAGEAMSRYPFDYDPADEKRERNDWASLGMKPMLDRLLAFAGKHALATGWHWGFVMGPVSCPEWCVAESRWVPRRGFSRSWPVSRVYFLCRRGQFSEAVLSKKLGIPVEEEAEKPRLKKLFWPSLWRIRIQHWRDHYDEVGVTLRDVKEFARLRAVMSTALDEMPQE